jgi:hypothetical protein
LRWRNAAALQSTTLVIIEPQSSVANLVPEHSVFFNPVMG